jgi:TPR repeat protein
VFSHIENKLHDYHVQIVSYANCNSQYESMRYARDRHAYCLNADLGHADAQKHIGDLYYHGLYGLNKDLTQAYVWYSLATNNGNN